MSDDEDGPSLGDGGPTYYVNVTKADFVATAYVMSSTVEWHSDGSTWIDGKRVREALWRQVANWLAEWWTVTTGRMQAKDIADADVLAAIERVKDIRDDGPYPIRTLGVSRWDLAAVLAGHAEDVAKYDGTRDRWDYPEVPPKVLAVKLVSMIRRGLVDGCEDVRCNCRGDFNAVGG